MMWQHHFEFLLLGYGAYLTFPSSAQRRCRTSPTSTSRRWWPASTWSCSAPTPSCAGSRGWRSTRASTARSWRAARRRRSTPRWPASDAGRAWLDELEEIKDPWFNMGTGDGLYHYYGSWHDDPSIPYASLIGHVAALNAGQATSSARPRSSRASATAWPRSTARCSTRRRAAPSRSCSGSRARSSRTSRSTSSTATTGSRRASSTRCASSARCSRSTASSRTARTSSTCRATRRLEALEELSLTWATGGPPLGPHHWPPIVARRRELLERLGEWTPPPALGAMPEAVNDPIVVMLWGITPQRLQQWAGAQDGGSELTGAAASPGRGRGAGAGA